MTVGRTNTFAKIFQRTDRSLSQQRISKLFRFGCHFAGMPSRGIIRRASAVALSREAKDLIMLPGTKVKSLVPRGIRGTFAKKKRTENPSALTHSFQQPLLGVHRVRENLPRCFNFVYPAMLPREKTEDREEKRSARRAGANWLRGGRGDGRRRTSTAEAK